MKNEIEPVISIIIPVYNSKKYLYKCLDSVIHQTYSKLEIICVDDESTDNSYDILKRYKKIDSRINVYKKKNEGVSFARNYALNYVTGDYILFVDSDDWIDERTCEIALKYAIESNYDVVMWSYVREMANESRNKQIFETNIIYENQKEVREKLHRRMIGVLGSELEKPENADALCTVWGKLYRGDIIRNNNIRFYDIREIGTYEDGLFNLDYFAQANNAIYINQYLYHYRRTEVDSLTNAYNDRLKEQWKTLFDIMDNYIVNNQLNDNYREALNNRISLSLIALGINAVTNNTTIPNKILEIKEIITSELYKQAVKTLKVEVLPTYWKIFFRCAKRENSIGVYLLLVVIQKIRGR